MKPRFRGALGKVVRTKRPVNNFGDLLGPLIVDRITELEGLVERDNTEARLLAVGSILGLARDHDVIWGTGINGKSLDRFAAPSTLDVRAVRGPRTRAVLEQQGLRVPPVFGDPGLLLPRLFALGRTPPGHGRVELTIVPNLHDFPQFAGMPEALDPRQDFWSIVRRIQSSELVVGSSLHAMVLADSFGVPARLMRSDAEPSFKYDDYFLGTGRTDYRPASSLEEAIRLGGGEPLNWDPEPLLDAFPRDLWLHR